VTHPQSTRYPGIYVVTKPGISSTEHAVHAIVAFFTCGFWLLGWLFFIAIAPVKRIEVIAPAGTTMDIIEEVKREALVLTPEEATIVRQKKRTVLTILGLIVAAVVGVCVWNALDIRI
jgi:hypothetical protein